MESILRQGLDEHDFEVIVVNDGSTDGSMARIADIVASHSNICVVEQSNQRLSVARNVGLGRAKGEYVFMPDSDDLLVDGSLSILLEKAVTSKADLVVADFVEVDDNEMDTVEVGPCVNPQFTEKTSSEMFLHELNPRECYVWRTLYRRAFLNENSIRFFPCIRYQDVPFTHECYLRAGRCIRTNMLLNIYRRQRPGAATASFNMDKAHDFCIAFGLTWRLKDIPGLEKAELRKLKGDVYTSFSSLVYATLFAIKEREGRLHVLRFLLQQAPDICFTNSLKHLLESLLLRLSPNLYLLVREWHLKRLRKKRKSG
jgi:glycosyltransferase involved in cell wall biosynthesis